MAIPNIATASRNVQAVRSLGTSGGAGCGSVEIAEVRPDMGVDMGDFMVSIN
jgi:hypothetical protein